MLHPRVENDEIVTEVVSGYWKEHCLRIQFVRKNDRWYCRQWYDGKPWKCNRVYLTKKEAEYNLRNMLFHFETNGIII